MESKQLMGFSELTTDSLYYALSDAIYDLITEYSWHGKYAEGDCWFEPHVGVWLFDDCGRIEDCVEGENFRMPCRPENDLHIGKWFETLGYVVDAVKKLRVKYSPATSASIEVVLVLKSDDPDSECLTVDYACVDVCLRS